MRVTLIAALAALLSASARPARAQYEYEPRRYSEAARRYPLERFAPPGDYGQNQYAEGAGRDHRDPAGWPPPYPQTAPAPAGPPRSDARMAPPGRYGQNYPRGDYQAQQQSDPRRYPLAPPRGGPRGDYPRTSEPPQRPFGQPYARRIPEFQTPGPGGNLGPYDDYRRQREEFRPQFAPRRAPAQPPPPELFEPGKVIAIVGDQHILAGDLLGDINQLLKPYEDKATKEQLDEQRKLLMQKMLPKMIQTKMMYQEMLANVPPEAVPEIEKKLADQFDENQLPEFIERAEVETAAELDAKLREYGSSIEKQRRLFSEQVLAREVMRQNVPREPEVSHQEMLDYYRENAKDYERPARVRWEELAVWKKNFDNKADAYREIANMGNRVLRGAAFSRVAREQSQGFTADNGGWHDWTTQGSLRAAELDEAIFTLPVGRLSRIIEAEDGFHIIRVLDREQAGRVPFFKEQVRIKKKLQKEKRDELIDEYLASVRERTRVWTIFDDGEE